MHSIKQQAEKIVLNVLIIHKNTSTQMSALDWQKPVFVFIIKRGKKMIYYYKELLESGLNRYQIEKIVKNKELYKIEKGIYSDEEFPNELAIITKKYSKAILTLNSAFFYYELTDKIPDYYYLATDKKARNIENKSIKQIFTKRELLDIGLAKMKIEDTEVNIYDKERMLIELIRYKSKLPYELYKEVLNNYRKIKDKLNFIKLYKYSQNFNNSYIMKTIETEVM